MNRSDFPRDVSVAVVAHNAAATLPDTLRSLREAGCPEARITVVDVASTDGTGAYLSRSAPGVHHRRLDANLGPSPGRNVAILECSTPWVLLMDADVMVEADAIDLLRRAAETPCAAIASAVVIHADRLDLIQYADTGFHFICEAINPYLDRPVEARGTDTRDIGAASGCALLIDCAVATAVGLFDERYFIGKEDGDFTHRVKLAGYRIVEPPCARVRHRSRRRGSWLFYYQIRNRWHVILKNYEVRTILVRLPALVLHEALQAIVLTAKGHALTYFRVTHPAVPDPRMHETGMGAALFRRGFFALFMGSFARECVSPVVISGGGGHRAGQRVPASFRQPAEPRHGAEHLRSSPRQARSLLDIRAAFWYGAVGREADLRWL